MDEMPVGNLKNSGHISIRLFEIITKARWEINFFSIIKYAKEVQNGKNAKIHGGP